MAPLPAFIGAFCATGVVSKGLCEATAEGGRGGGIAGFEIDKDRIGR